MQSSVHKQYGILQQLSDTGGSEHGISCLRVHSSNHNTNDATLHGSVDQYRSNLAKLLV